MRQSYGSKRNKVPTDKGVKKPALPEAEKLKLLRAGSVFKGSLSVGLWSAPFLSGNEKHIRR